MYWQVVGLIIDVVGVWFVAYELFMGQRKRGVIDMYQARKNTYTAHLESILQNLRSYPDSYPENEKKRLETEYREHWEPEIQKLTEEMRKINESHVWKSFKYGAIGVVLITICFIFQVIGVF
ncbi:MAG: hypothetical protein ACFFBU_07390 [Promethearchaeota archaeon]